MAPRPDDWMVEVELVEDDRPRGDGTAAGETLRPSGPRVSGASGGSGGSGGGAEPPSDAEPPPGRRPGGRWALLAAGLCVLVAAVAVGVGVTRGHSDGGLRLGSPLAGLWTLSRGTILGTAEGVVAVRSGESVAGYAENDGERLWELQLGPPAAIDACARAVTTSPATLWCWRNEQAVRTPNGETTQRNAAVVGVDMHDGSVVAEHLRTVPGSGIVAVGDALVVGSRVRGTLTLVLRDALTWDQEWATEIPLAQDAVSGQYQAAVSASGSRLVISGPTAAVIDARDGSVLQTWGGPSDDEAHPGGERTAVTVTARGFAAEPVLVDGTPTGHGTWYDAGGHEVVEYQGSLAEPTVSDGSEPGVVLVSRAGGSELAGVDVATGDDLWTLATDKATVVAREDGAVVLTSGSTVSSVELLTGWQQWSTRVDGLRADAGTASDGSVVVIMAVQRRAWVFDAVDVRSGEHRWTAPAAGTPDLDQLFYIGGAPRLEVSGEHLVVRSADGITWLG